MKIGVIFCAHQSERFIAPGPNCTLQPWIDLRARPDGHRFLIAAVCVPFVGFTQDEVPDHTEALLRERQERDHIDHLITSPVPLLETDARGQALRWLVEAGAEIVMQCDSDEAYTEGEIQRIFAFMASRPHVACAKGSLKNYVFDSKTYLVQPFSPMRIHRVRHNGYEARSFWDDNNVAYHGTITRDIVRDIDLPTVTIPKAVAWTRHMTWLNDGPSGRSHRKVRYQEARGWKSDFAWDDARGGLAWREGLVPPETAHD